MTDLNDKQKAGISAALDDISADRDDSLRTVGGYVVLEMLGKGAYGAVYKARRARGDMLVALKELPLTDVGIFGATDAERNAGVGRMNKEVEILSSLSHPNIVQVWSGKGEAAEGGEALWTPDPHRPTCSVPLSPLSITSLSARGRTCTSAWSSWRAPACWITSTAWRARARGCPRPMCGRWV